MPHNTKSGSEETFAVAARLGFSRPVEGTLLIHLAGSWKIKGGLPSAAEVFQETGPETKLITFDLNELTSWDSGLLTFLIKIIDYCTGNNVEVDRGGLPEGVTRLLLLASAVPDREGGRKALERGPFFAMVGVAAIDFYCSSVDLLVFIGEVFPATLKMIGGKARFRRSELVLIIQQVGVQALPIVSLISFLVGLILAFIGAIQLKLFGAQIYVADLVGIGMVREMGAIMTGIIMAGRTGASFAAELGTMQVNEEIDALTTLGIDPVEFLVLPRMVATTLMMPLLCLYADLMGILGGMVVGVGMLELNPIEYYTRTIEAVGLTNLWIGLFMGLVFGVLVSLAGCMRGMQCGRSSSAVGAATTSAVVTGIVGIIVATAVITIICDVLAI